MLKLGPVNCVIALSMALLIMPALTLNAQVGKDMGASPCYSCPKALPTRSATTNSNTNIPQVSAADRIREEAKNANTAGIEFFKKEDWVNAIAFFQQAVDKDPDDKVYQDNLAKATAELRFQQYRQQKDQQAINMNKTAVTKMQQAVQNFTQALNTAPSINGSDVDGKNSNSNAGKTTTATGLQFGDPNVVAAPNVPSGLSKSLNDAIAAAYEKAPAGVIDRVGRGFQAVQVKDWKLAKAWFGDALRLDPDNEGLKKFIELCDYSPQDKPATSNVPNPVVVPGPNTPSPAELNNFFKEFNLGVFSNTPAKIIQYVRSMPADEFRKYLNANLSNTQLNDIMFDNLIKLVAEQSQ
jgi:tetratricopeptide (TPR) repeat protein